MCQENRSKLQIFGAICECVFHRLRIVLAERKVTSVAPSLLFAECSLVALHANFFSRKNEPELATSRVSRRLR
jgi:hypothetical protein